MMLPDFYLRLFFIHVGRVAEAKYNQRRFAPTLSHHHRNQWPTPP